MPHPELLAILLVLVTCGTLLTGFPAAFVLGGCALWFAWLGSLLGAFDPALLGSLPSRLFGIMVNETLVAIPLFVLMGVVLERTAIAQDLLEGLGRLFGRRSGGLAIAITVVGALLAASTGIVGATVVAMGLMGLPAMLRSGYDPAFACGSICAAGTLGQIIPPSIVLVILADVIQAANAQAQLAQGNFAPDPVSIVDLFAGALLPGLLLVGLYLAYQTTVALFRPERCPALPDGWAGERRRFALLRAIAPPLLLMVVVLGSILAGLATPTESAGLGAAGAMLLAAVSGRLRLGALPGLAWAAMRIVAMIFAVLVGASVFSLVFRGLGGDAMVERLLTDLPGGAPAAVLVVMTTVFLLGFFLDFVEIVLVVVPIVGPVLLAMGLDPVWLGVLLAINLQTSFLTPPFGFALFYLRGVAPPEVATAAIYRGVVPFVALQLLALALVALAPGLATLLPGLLFD